MPRPLHYASPHVAVLRLTWLGLTSLHHTSLHLASTRPSCLYLTSPQPPCKLISNHLASRHLSPPRPTSLGLCCQRERTTDRWPRRHARTTGRCSHDGNDTSRGPLDVFCFPLSASGPISVAEDNVVVAILGGLYLATFRLTELRASHTLKEPGPFRCVLRAAFDQLYRSRPH